MSRSREILAVAVASLRLIFQPVELRIEQGALQFAEPVITGNHMMLVPHAGRNATAIVQRAAGGGQRADRSW